MAHDKDAVRKILAIAKKEGRNALTAPEGKLVCDAYGISVPGEGVARSPTGAVELASKMGYPVVLKIVSPDILHKTEAGGVLVGVNSAADVERGYLTIVENAKKYNANAQIVRSCTSASRFCVWNRVRFVTAGQRNYCSEQVQHSV